MSVRALTTTIAVFDVFLGIVPCATTGGHGKGHIKATNDHTKQQSTNRRKSVSLCCKGIDHEIHNHRSQNRQQARNNHFPDCRFGQKVNRTRIVRLRRAFHNAGIVAELCTHFFHNFSTSAANGHHAHGTKAVWQQGTQQQTNNHKWVREVKVHVKLREVSAKVFRIGTKQHQSGQRGRTNGITFGHGFCGVAHSVKRVSCFTNFFVQLGHLGDATGVIGHRTESVEGYNKASQRQHGGSSKAKTKNTGKVEGNQDSCRNRDSRKRSGFHANSQTLNDVCCVTGFGRLSNRLHRAVSRTCVVFCDPDDQTRQHKTNDATPENIHAGDCTFTNHERIINAASHASTTKGHINGKVETNNTQRSRDEETFVQSAHDRLAFAKLHEECANNRCQDTHATNRQRQGHNG